MYTPRPRQQEAIDKMVNFINSKTSKKGLFVYPTSMGKSIIIANVASKFPNKYFINIVPKKELLEQNYEKYTSYGYEGSICSASLGANEVSKVTFATIGTLKKHIDFFKDRDVVILVDEAQNGSLRGSQLDLFFKQIKKCKMVGTTATPLRLHNSMTGTQLKMMNRMKDCIFTSIEDVVQIKEMIDQEYWSPLIYDVENIDERHLKLNTTGTEYTVGSLKLFSESNDITSKCISSVHKLIDEGRDSIIIYTSLIEEAERIQNGLGDICVALHSKMSKKDREDAITRFKSGELKVISNVGILIEGFDKPDLSAIIMARPTNSITIYYQSIGRLVRIHPNKKDAKVIDISGNFNRFGKVEDITFEEYDWCGGWNAFSGDKLLTNFPLGGDKIPTKQSLIEAHNKKILGITEEDVIFYFGKYKGKKVSEIYKKDRSYLTWLIGDKAKFNFWGEKGTKLKKCIYETLKIPTLYKDFK